jgi:hypothetical protein
MNAVMDRRKWNWLDYFLFLIRTIWITSNGYSIFVITTGLEKWILLLLASCSYIIPHLFYRPGLIRFQYYLIAEVLLTGSLFIYLSSQYGILEIYSFLFLPILTIAYACQVKPLIWLGPFLSIIIFLAGTLVGNQLTDQDIFGLIVDTTIFYGIGLFLGRMTIVNNANKELIASIEEKTGT